MPVKKKIPFDSGHFFITFTCYNWLPLIEITNSYDLLCNWFDILKKQGHYITGYAPKAFGVPNHVHATIAFCKTKKGINTIIGDGKRFIGYEIVNRLKAQGKHDLLIQLENAVNGSDKNKGKLHEVWEDSFDWKEYNSSKFIFQKLDYMHINPCTGKWQLSVNALEYLHSSAKFYACGQQGIYTVLNFQELNDISLNSFPG